MITLPRRRFFSGLGGLLAAPAIVRFSSLMPVRVAPLVIVPDWLGLAPIKIQGTRMLFDDAGGPVVRHGVPAVPIGGTYYRWS